MSLRRIKTNQLVLLVGEVTVKNVYCHRFQIDDAVLASWPYSTFWANLIGPFFISYSKVLPQRKVDGFWLNWLMFLEFVHEDSCKGWKIISSIAGLVTSLSIWWYSLYCRHRYHILVFKTLYHFLWKPRQYPTRPNRMKWMYRRIFLRQKMRLSCLWCVSVVKNFVVHEALSITTSPSLLIEYFK